MSTIHHNVDSKILGGERRLRIWLPPAYEHDPSGESRFAVVYQNDGQTALTERDQALPYGSFGTDWWLEVLSGRKEIVPTLVVAIDNSTKREKEYFPASEEFKLYEKFLLEEVVPWVDENFRTLDNAKGRVTLGASMGGLASFALAWRNPAVFGRAMCMSPWFEYQDYHYVREVLRKDDKKPDVQLYLDSGIRDWRDLDDGHRGTMLARKELLEKGYQEERDFLWHTDTWFPTDKDLIGSSVETDHRPSAKINQHNEFQWRQRLDKGLRFLLKP